MSQFLSWKFSSRGEIIISVRRLVVDATMRYIAPLSQAQPLSQVSTWTTDSRHKFSIFEIFCCMVITKTLSMSVTVENSPPQLYDPSLLELEMNFSLDRLNDHRIGFLVISPITLKWTRCLWEQLGYDTIRSCPTSSHFIFFAFFRSCDHATILPWVIYLSSEQNIYNLRHSKSPPSLRLLHSPILAKRFQIWIFTRGIKKKNFSM